MDRSSRALLLIARCADGTAAGFAAIEPLGGGNEAVAELGYLGARPLLWGEGIGERLLLEIGQRLKTAGYVSVQLSVYVDNRRAIALYERLGWLPRGGPAAPPDRQAGATLRAAPAGDGSTALIDVCVTIKGVIRTPD